MHKKLMKRKSRSKSEKAFLQHGLHRKTMPSPQTMFYWIKLKASQEYLLQTCNDKNYYQAIQTEALHAFA